MSIFEEPQVFIFPNMIRCKFIYIFFDVVEIVIIHKKIATFGYRQVVLLKICLNLSIYYGNFYGVLL